MTSGGTVKTLRTLTLALAAGTLLAPLCTAQADKDIRATLVKYLQADKKARMAMLKKEIKDLGDPAVPIIQAAMDVLIPCYRKADQALTRAKRRKKEITPLEEKKVTALVIAVVGKGEAPAPELSKAEAQKGLRACLGPLAAARSTLAGPTISKFLEEQAKLGVSYPGQYKPLKKRYGRAAMAVLLNTAMRTDQTGWIRLFALVALRDVADKGEPAVLRNLRKITADEFIDKRTRRVAATTMAVLGDDSAMEPFFTELHKLTKRSNLKAQARGWEGLGRLWHDMGEYKQAIGYLTKLVGVMTTLVDEKKRHPQDLAAAYSRRACSYAMAGKVNEGIADIKQAIKLGGVRRKGLELDKELDSLRKHPEWKKIVESAPEKLKKRKY